MVSCELPFKYFDKLQTFPVADIIHVGIGFLIYHYLYLLFIPILYTIAKLICVKGETFLNRIPSIFEFLLGFLIAFSVDKLS